LRPDLNCFLNETAFNGDRTNSTHFFRFLGFVGAQLGAQLGAQTRAPLRCDLNCFLNETAFNGDRINSTHFFRFSGFLGAQTRAPRRCYYYCNLAIAFTLKPENFDFKG
jgi:hypothetical protein